MKQKPSINVCGMSLLRWRGVRVSVTDKIHCIREELSLVLVKNGNTNLLAYSSVGRDTQHTVTRDTQHTAHSTLHTTHSVSQIVGRSDRERRLFTFSDMITPDLRDQACQIWASS